MLSSAGVLRHLSRTTLPRHARRHFTPSLSFPPFAPLLLHRAFASFTISVPSLGDSITEGSIVEVTKKAGDAVDTDEVVARLETDKVTIDLRSSGKGTITTAKIKQGDVVHPGDVAFEADDAVGGGAAPAPPKAQHAEPPAEKTEKKESKQPASPAPPSSSSPAPSPPSTRTQAIDSHDDSEQAHAHHPLIAFRYGKRPTSSFHPDPSPSFTQPRPLTSSPASSSSSSGLGGASYFNADGWREANEAAAKARRSLPRYYVRQPRLSAAEQEVVMMGGATPYTPKSQQKDEKPATKGDKPPKK